MTTVLVTRHPGAVEWAARQGLVADRQVVHLDPSTIRPGDMVIGTLPVNLAAEVCTRGGRFFNLSLEVPPDARGRELTADDLVGYGARIEEFVVHRAVRIAQRHASLASDHVREPTAVLEGVVSRNGHVDETGWCGRAEKGVVLRYLVHTTGYSRQQLTRLVKRHLEAGGLAKRYRPPARGFARKFTPEDVALLAETDGLHGTLSGPATRHLFERAATVHGDARFARLATISVAHLYNLRRASGYVERRQQWSKTRPVTLPIGERRAPAPDGQPGFIRIDSVHQGDQDGVKGVYHINAVDCVTQWELVATCERISEAFMLPVIQALLEGFPFVIKGFHADNGSEYINHQVARLLDKLRVEFTKSRPRHSNDNGLAETKNGAVVRKCLGYAHIPQRFATEVNAFCADFLNPYLNFHRPCLFAEAVTDAKGKVRKHYPLRLVMTPFEKLKSIQAARVMPKTRHDPGKPGKPSQTAHRQRGRRPAQPGQETAISIHLQPIQDRRMRTRKSPRSDSYLYWN